MSPLCPHSPAGHGWDLAPVAGRAHTGTGLGKESLVLFFLLSEISDRNPTKAPKTVPAAGQSRLLSARGRAKVRKGWETQ